VRLGLVDDEPGGGGPGGEAGGHDGPADQDRPGAGQEDKGATMMDDPVAPQNGEPDAEATAQHPPCRNCGGPVVPPKRRGLVKAFCKDRCRAAYRDKRIAAAIAEVALAVAETRQAIDQVTGELDRLVARLDGAAQLLDQTRPKKKTQGEPKRLDTD
jgi:uncharacterized coiled-coil protein SlyX